MKDLLECAEDVLDKTSSMPARPPKAWEQHEREGHMPKLSDCPICVEEHGSVLATSQAPLQAFTPYT